MAPDSKTEIGFPSGPLRSTIAGVLLFGLILRNSGLNCSPVRMLTGRTSYSRPVSSTMMWILCPLGVGQVYTSIIGNFLSFSSCSPFGNSTETLARPAGVEPTTPSLEGWCSIQFELRARAKTYYGRLGGDQKIWSGWRDLNSRHLAPKASALPGCATPRGCRILRLRASQGQRFAAPLRRRSGPENRLRVGDF